MSELGEPVHATGVDRVRKWTKRRTSLVRRVLVLRSIERGCFVALAGEKANACQLAVVT